MYAIAPKRKFGWPPVEENVVRAEGHERSQALRFESMTNPTLAAMIKIFQAECLAGETDRLMQCVAEETDHPHPMLFHEGEKLPSYDPCEKWKVRDVANAERSTEAFAASTRNRTLATHVAINTLCGLKETPLGDDG